MNTTKETGFIQRIDQLPTGERAALRHACGLTLEQAGGNALSAFYRALPHDIWQGNEGGWFIGACLRCMWRPEETMELSMEQALFRLDQCSDGDSVKKQLIALLDTPMDEDGYFARKLWRTVKLLRQRGYVIDCAGLIADICQWNNAKRNVQKRWARAFCQTDLSVSQQTNENKGENENAD